MGLLNSGVDLRIPIRIMYRARARIRTRARAPVVLNVGDGIDRLYISIVGHAYAMMLILG